MIWNKLLIIYLIILSVLGTLIIILPDKISDNDVYFNSQEADISYAETIGLDSKAYLPPTLAEVRNLQLILVKDGENAPFIPPSDNPYEFNRDWSYRIERYKQSTITYKTALLKNADNDFFVLCQYEMDMDQAQQATGENSLLVKWTPDYQLSNTISKAYLYTKNEFIQTNEQGSFASDTGIFSLPSIDFNIPYRNAEIVGYVIFKISDNPQSDFFESVIDLYDHETSKTEAGIIIGFNHLDGFGYQDYYLVKSEQIVYTKAGA